MSPSYSIVIPFWWDDRYILLFIEKKKRVQNQMENAWNVSISITKFSIQIMWWFKWYCHISYKTNLMDVEHWKVKSIACWRDFTDFRISPHTMSSHNFRLHPCVNFMLFTMKPFNKHVGNLGSKFDTSLFIIMDYIFKFYINSALDEDEEMSLISG